MRVTNHIVGGCPRRVLSVRADYVLSRSLQLFTPGRSGREGKRREWALPTGGASRITYDTRARPFGRLELEQSDIIHRLLPTGPLNRQGEDHDRNIVCPGQFLGSVA
jgi:hypothetical protein